MLHAESWQHIKASYEGFQDHVRLKPYQLSKIGVSPHSKICKNLTSASFSDLQCCQQPGLYTGLSLQGHNAVILEVVPGVSEKPQDLRPLPQPCTLQDRTAPSTEYQSLIAT